MIQRFAVVVAQGLLLTGSLMSSSPAAPVEPARAKCAASPPSPLLDRAAYPKYSMERDQVNGLVELASIGHIPIEARQSGCNRLVCRSFTFSISILMESRGGDAASLDRLSVTGEGKKLVERLNEFDKKADEMHLRDSCTKRGCRIELCHDGSVPPRDSRKGCARKGGGAMIDTVREHRHRTVVYEICDPAS